MRKELLNLNKIQLVGIQVRTSNENEMNRTNAKIAPCVQQYFEQQLSEKIQNRKNPGRTFCIYTDYESDYNGAYTFFIGEEVNSLEGIPEGFTDLSIPAQKYAKFTTDAKPMPNVVIEAWQRIWQMSPQDLGGKRRYIADFEIYDERAQDPSNTILDIYIGIEE